MHQIRTIMVAVGAEVLDVAADHSGRPGYGQGYYTACYADPDGAKLGIVYEPHANP